MKNLAPLTDNQTEAEVFKALESSKLGDNTAKEIDIEEKPLIDEDEAENYHREIFLSSEDENVERFIRLARDRLVTIGDKTKKWYCYDDTKGVFVLNNSAPRKFYRNEVCKEIERDCFTYFQKHKGDNNKQTLKEIEKREKGLVKSKTDKMANAVLRMAFDELYKGNSETDYFNKTEKQDIVLFNCLNCTLRINLRTGDIESLPHNPDYKLTFCADVVFDKKADCPRWKEIIKTYMLDDKETALYLQALLGISIVGANKDQIFVNYLGTGSNGKSTLIKHILAIMGDYGLKSKNDIFTKGDNGTVDQNVLYALWGKRFVVCSEGDKRAVLDCGMIKDITGGVEISCRPNYSPQVSFKPSFIPILETNELPKIYDNGKAIERRARVIPFDREIKREEIDPFLDSELEKEYSGILNWLIAGLKLWIKNGCSLDSLTSERIKIASKQYILANDNVGNFAREELIADPKSYITYAKAYELFKTYCLNIGKKTINRDDFIKRLKEIYGLEHFIKRNSDTNETKPYMRNGVYTINGIREREHIED